jgi:hypothetical protein
MLQEPYVLDQVSRSAVLTAIQQHCAHRGWNLLAVHVRSNHVHVVVEADAQPERIVNEFKSYASRELIWSDLVKCHVRPVFWFFLGEGSPCDPAGAAHRIVISPERRAAGKGAPGFGAAKRTLADEHRSGIPVRLRWAALAGSHPAGGLGAVLVLLGQQS